MLSMHIDTGEVSAFQETLKNYLAARKKGVGEVLAEKAQSLMIGAKGVKGLFQLTADAAPKKGDILAEFERRNWRIRPHGTETHLATIRRRAAQRLGSSGSTFGSVQNVGDGLVLREARVGARGRRIISGRGTGTRGGGKRQRGGRAAVGGAESMRLLGKMDGEKTINRRNVEVLTDLNLRQQAIKHTALGWASFGRRVWRRGAGFPTGEFRMKRAEGTTGTVVFAQAGDSYSAVITNKNKAMAKLDSRRGIVAAAVNAAKRDMLTYLAQSELRKAKALERKK